MEDILTSTFFRYVAFPVGSAGFGVLVKYVSRNDKYAKFTKEDLFIGLELVLTACLMYVVLTTDRAIQLKAANENLAAALAANPFEQADAARLQATIESLSDRIDLAGWVILLMFVGLWSVSTIVRKWGWASETEMKPVVGIALPLAFGVLALLLVMSEASP